MPNPKRLDHQAILADHAAGMSRSQLAQKYQAHKSTIRWHLMRDAEPQPKPESPDPTRRVADASATFPDNPAAPHNGASNGHTSIMPPVSELEHLLAEHWNRLPLVERVRILLARS